jgi:aminoglycoside phosphotransferase (APT) family kinase protein
LHSIVHDARAVGTSDQLDVARLAAYLRDQLPARGLAGFDPARKLEVERFPGGGSNLTYLLHAGEIELVLRRPPSGPVPPKAHDMAREYRVLSLLHPVFPLAPRPYLLCSDPTHVGSIFYLMERRRGIVVREEEPAELSGRPEVRRRVSEALVDALADLHAIDIDAHGLGSLGRPAGFVERQVSGWTERWRQSRTSALPEMEALAEWLRGHLPPEPVQPSVVHGDFKLDNVMLDTENPGQIVAVFDWEMSALGDPLVDLGILLTYWGPTGPPGSSAHEIVTSRAGWLTRTELVARYAARSGRDVSGIGFYETFGIFKVAVVVQQLYSRYATGRTDDPRYATFETRVEYLAREAAARLSHMA